MHKKPARVQSNMARRYAWIWLVGCIAWALDALANLRLRQTPHAELAAIMAVLFGVAWLFYRAQQR